VDANERARWERREREDGFLRVRLRLLTSDEGGRRGPIAGGYRASWNIGSRVQSDDWTISDAPLLLEDREDEEWLAPGATADVRIHPLFPEFWTHVVPGDHIDMHEGSRVVGHGEVLEIVAPLST
jgi:hypothetical protein